MTAYHGFTDIVSVKTGPGVSECNSTLVTTTIYHRLLQIGQWFSRCSPVSRDSVSGPNCQIPPIAELNRILRLSLSSIYLYGLSLPTLTDGLETNETIKRLTTS